MAKKHKKILTIKDLERAVRTAPEKTVRECLRRIALEAFVDEDGTLNADKELGADFISEVVLHLEAAGLRPDEPASVVCRVCGEPTDAATAHLHQGGWIGDECWDDRLKASE